MTNSEKDMFCLILKNAKLPFGSASNVARFVHMKERKVSGYKSRDVHFVLHYLLQFAVKKSSKHVVAIPLIKSGAFLRGIWSKVIDLSELKKLQQETVEILCQFETIFTQAFFDIMVHLLIHLCRELAYGGPAHLRSMWLIERYLCKIKTYVRNRSKPEGSIVEGYLPEECLTFCSSFLGDDAGSKIIKSARFQSCLEKTEYHIGTRRNKDGTTIHLKESQWTTIHRYILFNCGNKEIEELIEQHQALVDGQAKSKRYKRAREHTEDLWKWMKEEVDRRGNVSKKLEVLAMGPNQAAKKYSGYQQNNKKARQLDSLKPPQGGTRKSPQLKPPKGDEIMRENDPESGDTILPPSSPLTEYEIERAIRVHKNNQVLLQLNLPALSAEMRNSVQRNKGKKKMIDENEDYDPEQDAGSDGDASVTPPKMCHSYI
ncbi:hypothetical protein POM88_005371 [Heracleum sosnowskyi]|uniref:DUF4218 domain-containing protein n=1 Tax=Heracleum sosnowskyi TaxID=360622 RepID=A0AAD8NF27_9APIA|nr:hypothetical protein POM88_005371 [Heracleum sosnowskyi]